MSETLQKVTAVVTGALVAVGAFALIASTQATAMGRPGASNGTIIDIAEANGFTSLAAALECAGLVETFQGNRQFTVFAPTNAAFADALSALGVSFEELCEDKETLTSILTYHVSPGVKTSKNVLNRPSVNTLNGQMAPVNASAGTIAGATITATDFRATNGVVHVIDAVMVPQL